MSLRIQEAQELLRGGNYRWPKSRLRPDLPHKAIFPVCSRKSLVFHLGLGSVSIARKALDLPTVREFAPLRRRGRLRPIQYSSQGVFEDMKRAIQILLRVSDGHVPLQVRHDASAQQFVLEHPLERAV